MEKQRINYWLLLVISIIFGWFGVDRFLLKNTKLGILKLCTLGACGVWWFIDVILAATKYYDVEYTTSKTSRNVGIGVMVLFFLYGIFAVNTGEDLKTGEDLNKKNKVVQSKNTPTKKVVPTKAPTIKPTEKPVQIKTLPVPTNTPKPTITDVKLPIELTKLALVDSYKGIADVELNKEKNLISIIPTDSAFTFSVMNAKGNKKNEESWEKIKKGLVDVSNGTEKDNIIQLCNPMNKERVFLMVTNGVVVYDYLQ